VTSEQRRALELLASAGDQGVPEELMLKAFVFEFEVIIGLIRDGLAAKCGVPPWHHHAQGKDDAMSTITRRTAPHGWPEKMALGKLLTELTALAVAVQPCTAFAQAKIVNAPPSADDTVAPQATTTLRFDHLGLSRRLDSCDPRSQQSDPQLCSRGGGRVRVLP
jgi:hypothetical protein